MARNLILLTTSILIFLSCSCCKQPKHQYGIKPLYEIQLPTGTSAEIYYNGLYTMPMYKDWIIAHTSIADDGIFREDNRLCAVNIKKNKLIGFSQLIQTNAHTAHLMEKGICTKINWYFDTSKILTRSPNLIGQQFA